MTNYFSKNIKYLRNKKNIDQKVMAEDLGVAQSTLSCWENGLRTPDLDMITKISKYLNITDNFITKDLTKEYENQNHLKTIHILYDKFKNLPEYKQKMILNITEAVMKDIDEQIDDKWG